MRSRTLQLREYSAVARGAAPREQNVLIPGISSPAQQLSKLFAYQSYFDSTLLERAILTQTRNEPIVASTAAEEQIPGYAIGLHPSSQTPVAIQFKIGAQKSSSQAIILKPGQVVRPYGLPKGVSDGSFSGFVWGLPFGWLGGGQATILVFQTPDADVAWPGDSEVIFHRQRMQILAQAALPAAAPKNWPLRFPWLQAIRGTDSVSQQGDALISVARPTRVIMRLRVSTLAAAATMRIIFHETNDFDLDEDGAVIANQVGFIDQTWDLFASAGAAGNLATQYPYIEIDDIISRLAADNGGIQLMAMDAALNSLYVDVVRYGRL